jgi:hypothetical protein
MITHAVIVVHSFIVSHSWTQVAAKDDWNDRTNGSILCLASSIRRYQSSLVYYIAVILRARKWLKIELLFI